MGELETVLRAVSQSGARYLVVGGVGVVLHGYARFTADLDLVVQLEPSNLRRVLDALAALEYRPRAPVPASHMLDPAIRAQWADEKGMTVFSLWSPRYPTTEVDIFVREPFDFENAAARAVTATIADFDVLVAAIEDLVAMKREAGRPKDLDDINALLALGEEDSNDGQ